MLKHSKKAKIKKSKGFTLIELLVTLSIFVIVTGVVLFGQTQFNSSILLTNLAYDLALTIRQAQTFGVGGKIVDVGTRPSYGVHVDVADGKSIIFFYDTNSVNGVLDGDECNETPDETNECVERYNIKSSNSIKAICLPTDDNTQCVDSFDSVDITFKRPDPNARIIFDNKENTESTIGAVQIDVGSDSDSQIRSVVVTDIGQIYIKK